MRKWLYILGRLPVALRMAYMTYKVHMLPQHKVAWKNAKGYFKLALAWKK